MAAVDVIYPLVDAKSRTVPVRLILNNDRGLFKPDQYLDATFSSNVSPRLIVPQEAVLYDGTGAYVVRSIGDGFFQKSKVSIGITSDGYSEILEGLSEGDEIVKSGQFMIDAESQLSGAMPNMNMSGEDHE